MRSVEQRRHGKDRLRNPPHWIFRNLGFRNIEPRFRNIRPRFGNIRPRFGNIPFDFGYNLVFGIFRGLEARHPPPERGVAGTLLMGGVYQSKVAIILNIVIITIIIIIVLIIIIIIIINVERKPRPAPPRPAARSDAE